MSNVDPCVSLVSSLHQTPCRRRQFKEEEEEKKKKTKQPSQIKLCFLCRIVYRFFEFSNKMW